MPSFLPALAELEGRGHKVGGEIPPISSLFEGLANLVTEVAPGAGDYIAGKRALEAYGNMGEMMKQGQYMDAASYGAQGLTEQISTIPAIGEIATGAKMFTAGVGALKGFPNARPDWIHGSPESGIDKLDEPVFLTKDPEGANYFATERGYSGSSTIYPYRYEPANALDLDTLKGSKKLLRISEDLGINTRLYDYTNLKKITPEEITNKIEWHIDAPRVVNEIGYGGDNLFNLSYIPEVRQGLKNAGYDAIRGQDALMNNSIETLVPLYPERLIPAYEGIKKLSPKVQRVADQLMLSEMPDNFRIGRSYGKKKSWYVNENEGGFGDGVWGWGTNKEEAIKDYRANWVNRYKKTGAKTFGEVQTATQKARMKEAGDLVGSMK